MYEGRSGLAYLVAKLILSYMLKLPDKSWPWILGPQHGNTYSMAEGDEGKRVGERGWKVFKVGNNVLGILCGKSETTAAIYGSLLFLTATAGSHPPAGFPKDVGMPCGPFGSSSDKGSWNSRMNILTWHLRAQNAHGIRQNLYDPPGWLEVGREWL